MLPDILICFFDKNEKVLNNKEWLSLVHLDVFLFL